MAIIKGFFALYFFCLIVSLVFNLAELLFDFIYENSPFVAVIEYFYKDARHFLMIEAVVAIILTAAYFVKNAKVPVDAGKNNSDSK